MRVLELIMYLLVILLDLYTRWVFIEMLTLFVSCLNLLVGLSLVTGNELNGWKAGLPCLGFCQLNGASFGLKYLLFNGPHVLLLG